jgi:hypothetical protein
LITRDRRRLVRLAKKTWLKVLLTDLSWERNIVGWLTDSADNLKRTGSMLFFFLKKGKKNGRLVQSTRTCCWNNHYISVKAMIYILEADKPSHSARPRPQLCKRPLDTRRCPRHMWNSETPEIPLPTSLLRRDVSLTQNKKAKHFLPIAITFECCICFQFHLHRCVLRDEMNKTRP